MKIHDFATALADVWTTAHSLGPQSWKKNSGIASVSYKLAPAIKISGIADLATEL